MNEFQSSEDLIRFASTPCLLLNDSVDKMNLDNSRDDLRVMDNPFKKKTAEPFEGVFPDEEEWQGRRSSGKKMRMNGEKEDRGEKEERGVKHADSQPEYSFEDEMEVFRP